MVIMFMLIATTSSYDMMACIVALILFFRRHPFSCRQRIFDGVRESIHSFVQRTVPARLRTSACVVVVSHLKTRQMCDFECHWKGRQQAHCIGRRITNGVGLFHRRHRAVNAALCGPYCQLGTRKCRVGVVQHMRVHKHDLRNARPQK